MARKSKAEKEIEKKVNAAFVTHGGYKQFNVFDVTKILQAGEQAAKNGTSIEDAVKAACDKYEIKKH